MWGPFFEFLGCTTSTVCNQGVTVDVMVGAGAARRLAARASRGVLREKCEPKSSSKHLHSTIVVVSSPSSTVPRLHVCPLLICPLTITKDPFLQKCIRESVGCEQQLSRWMHLFKSIHLKVRGGYSSEDRARFVASAVQRCPKILQICEIIMRQGPLSIKVGPGPDDVKSFSSIQDLPQVHPRVVEIWVLCAIIAKYLFKLRRKISFTPVTL
jgi:hypothetical protein